MCIQGCVPPSQYTFPGVEISFPGTWFCTFFTWKLYVSRYGGCPRPLLYIFLKNVCFLRGVSPLPFKHYPKKENDFQQIVRPHGFIEFVLGLLEFPGVPQIPPEPANFPTILVISGRDLLQHCTPWCAYIWPSFWTCLPPVHTFWKSFFEPDHSISYNAKNVSVHSWVRPPCAYSQVLSHPPARNTEGTREMYMYVRRGSHRSKEPKYIVI